MNRAESILKTSLLNLQDKIAELGFPADHDLLPTIVLEPPATSDLFSQFKELNGFEIPNELVGFFTHYASAEMPYEQDSWNHLSLSVDVSRGHTKLFPGLFEFIDWSWGGRPEISKSFTPTEVEYVNTHYKCFGHYVADDNIHDYLVFGKNGEFYSFRYDQDSWSNFESLLRSQPTPKSLSDLVDHFVNLVLERLKEDRDELDTELGGETYRPNFFLPVKAETKLELAKTEKTQDQLLVDRIAKLALENDAVAMFDLLLAWPHRSAFWAEAVKSRTYAPSCTEEQRKILKKLLVKI